jgi:hypothetical protein
MVYFCYSDHQQEPPRLTFCQSLSKVKLEKWIGSCYNAFTPQKYTGVQSKILLRIKVN